MLQLQGTLKVKMEAAQVTEKFRKREFVVQDNTSQYPQLICFQLSQDKCSMIDNFNVGQEIRVNFNLRGREWNDPKTNTIKYFNTIEAWKIEAVNAQQTNPVAGSGTPMSSPEVTTFASTSSESDDLPF